MVLVVPKCILHFIVSNMKIGTDYEARKETRFLTKHYSSFDYPGKPKGDFLHSYVKRKEKVAKLSFKQKVFYAVIHVNPHQLIKKSTLNDIGKILVDDYGKKAFL